MGWVVLPPSKIYQCSYCSLFSPSLLCRRAEHGYSEIKTHLAGRSVSRRPEHLQHRPRASPKIPEPWERGRAPGPGGGGRTSAEAEPGRQHQHHPLVRPPARSWDSRPSAAATVPATARLPKTGGCLWDGLLASFVVRSVGFLFAVVSDEVCRTPVHLLLFLSKHPHSPCHGRDRFARQ